MFVPQCTSIAILIVSENVSVYITSKNMYFALNLHKSLGHCLGQIRTIQYILELQGLRHYQKDPSPLNRSNVLSNRQVQC